MKEEANPIIKMEKSKEIELHLSNFPNLSNCTKFLNRHDNFFKNFHRLINLHIKSEMWNILNDELGMFSPLFIGLIDN